MSPKRINPETSELAAGLRTDRMSAALAALRLAALTIDVAVKIDADRQSVQGARASLSWALRDAFKHIRQCITLAELAVDGRDPVVAAVYLIRSLDEAAVHLAKASRNSLVRLHGKRT